MPDLEPAPLRPILVSKKEAARLLRRRESYIDELVHTPEGLRLRSRLCVYDSEMVLNSLIYPI